MAALLLQTLASHWLCHSAKEGRQDVRVTKTMCGADLRTDHSFLTANLTFAFSLHGEHKARKWQRDWIFPSWYKTVRGKHSSMIAVARCAGAQFRGPTWELDSLQRHRPLFSNRFPTNIISQTQRLVDENNEEIQGLLEEKHQTFKAYISDTNYVSSKIAYSNVCETVQNRLRDMQESWLSKKANKIQSFANRKDIKKFFDALETVYGPQSLGYIPLRSADGTIVLTDNALSWKDGLNNLMVSTRPSSISDEAINRLPQVECNPLRDDFPTISETVKAIKPLPSGKAPGSDAILAEINKAGGLPVAEKLTKLFHILWRKEAIPQEFKDASVIHLFKLKGNPQICDNHRDIFLLSTAGWEDPCKMPSWTDWMNTLNSQDFYQKANAGSRRTEEQLTWSSQQYSFKRNARNKMWTSTYPLSVFTKHLTVSLRDPGKLWKSLAARPSSKQWCGSSTMIHVCLHGFKWWRVFLSIPCDKSRRARLCTSFDAVQHDVSCHAHRCFPGWWQWYTY